MTRCGTVRYGTNPQNPTSLDSIPNRAVAKIIHWKNCMLNDNMF